jgi:large subunit ribosomal protein L25
MEVLRGDVEMMSPADRIPAHIEVEVTHLEIGDAVRAKDLKLPEGITIHQNPNAVIVHCTHPRKVEEVAPVPGAEAAAAGAAPAAGAAAPAAGAAAPAAGAAAPAAGAKGAAAPAAAAPAAKAAPKK